MMKVVKEVVDKSKEFTAFSLRLKTETVSQLDMVKKKHKVSRNRLVESIVEQVLADKDFVLTIKD